MSGFLELERARVRWYLSVDMSDLPEASRKAGKTTFRTIVVDGAEFEFSDGFTDLHTKVYALTLAGKGFGIKDARQSIELVHKIRNLGAKLQASKDVHPFALRGNPQAG